MATDETTPHPAVAAVERRLPAQVTTLTHESGAQVAVRLMDGNATPMAARIAVDFLRWLSAEAHRDDESYTAGWLNGIEDEIHLRHPEIEGKTDGH